MSFAVTLIVRFVGTLNKREDRRLPFWPDADSIQLMAHILWIEQAEVLPTEQLLEALTRMRKSSMRQGYCNMVDAVDAALFGFDKTAGNCARRAFPAVRGKVSSLHRHR